MFLKTAFVMKLVAGVFTLTRHVTRSRTYLRRTNSRSCTRMFDGEISCRDCVRGLNFELRVQPEDGEDDVVVENVEVPGQHRSLVLNVDHALVNLPLGNWKKIQSFI